MRLIFSFLMPILFVVYLSYRIWQAAVLGETDRLPMLILVLLAALLILTYRIVHLKNRNG